MNGKEIKKWLGMDEAAVVLLCRLLCVLLCVSFWLVVYRLIARVLL